MASERPAIIGGMFGLGGDVLAADPPPFWRPSQLLLVNARAGLRLLVEQGRPQQVWLPAYICDVMVAAVQAAGQSPRFYPLGPDLRADGLAWQDDVRQGDLVVVVDYFGFPPDETVIQAARNRGARVVEDAAQALLSSHPGADADFVLFSPRKFVGVPDGGILRVKDKAAWIDADPPPPPGRWWLQAFTAGVLRREFDRHGGQRRWFQLFQEAERTAPSRLYAMSTLAEALLRHSFDYASIARKRVANYRALASALERWALYPELPDHVVPVGFPIRLPERDRVRQALFAREIFPPVHWPLAGVIPHEFRPCHELAEQIMTLPCDQRYNQGDMERIIQGVLQEVGS